MVVGYTFVKSQMEKTPEMIRMFIGIGLCSCALFIVINSHLGALVEFSKMADTSESRVEVDNQNTSNLTNPNVLFFIVDDLRPQLGAYFDPKHPNYFSRNRMITPNIDKLAKKSLLFKHAYVQQPLCGPSRASMLTSRRPDVTRAYSNGRYWRDVGGNFTTLPQYFKEQGYLSYGFGKVYHTGASSGHDDPISWTEEFYKPPFSDMHYMPRGVGAGWVAVERKARDTVPLTDDQTVIHAKSKLKELSEKARNGDQPFFMAVGFRKPHISLVCPEEFYRFYKLENETQFLAEKSWQTPAVRKTCDMGNITEKDGNFFIGDPLLRQLRRAYFSCVSYTDYNIGLVMKELDRLGLSNTTIVSLVADHGYHLGENGLWGKMTPYEVSTRVPMMIHIPGQTDTGIVTESVVEALDLYPTIVEAAGFDPMPECPQESSNVPFCTQGVSLLPLITNPEQIIKQAALSQTTALPDAGYTIRNEKYRFVERARNVERAELDWDDSGKTWQLYDHAEDPEERTNLAEDPDYKKVTDEMRELLHTMVIGSRGFT